MSPTSRLPSPAVRATLAVAALAVCLSMSSGCALFKKPTPTVVPPPPVPPPPVVLPRLPPPPAEPVDTPGKRLERADALLASDQIEAAAGELHSLVEEHPASAEAPQALFQLAVVYLSPDSPVYDGTQGIALLRDLVDTYPGSSWSLASQTILRLERSNASLRDVAAQLEKQLDQLKRIDIDSDG